VLNRQDAASDIDVLVIGSPRGEALAEAAPKLERQLGREINYTILTRREFKSRRARKDAFLENVWHNKHILCAPIESASDSSTQKPSRLKKLKHAASSLSGAAPRLIA
jgi:hypothetical protein